MRLFWVCLFSFIINNSAYAAPLIIGTLAYDPPFETASDKTGDFFGFDIDVMNEICNRLRATCKYKSFPFEQLLHETQFGKLDLAIAGISITAEREQFALFSLPYLASKAGLLTKSSSAITKFSDVNGKRIGIEAGTVFKGIVLKKFPNVKLVEYKEQNDLFQAVADNNVDLIMLDEASAKYWISNNGDLFKLVGGPISIGVGYGIMANLNNSALINQINGALISMENDGSYLSIYNRYF